MVIKVSRVESMPLLGLVVVFIVLPLAELYLIYKVGDAIGVIPTLLLLAADSVIGSLLLRSQGRAAWRRLNEALAAGRMPHQEVQDGVLVVFGGAFLITPGFITDVIGLLMLLPPTRPLVRRLVMRALTRRVERRVTRPRGSFDVEGTATEHDAPPGQLPR
jgi:UPF0716 protein FxsA